jgi:predicted AlkP superfamily pyrophosphatase or phosphodiesterase
VKNFLFIPFLLSGFLISAQNKKPGISALPKPEKPKLVVGIVVDQMRYDFLFRYKKNYSQGGFKRLLREGFSFSNCQYSYAPTVTGPGHASVFTGTTPWVHGIVGNNWYDKSLGMRFYCTQDDSVSGIGGTGKESKMSPKNMRSFSIADQVKLASNGKGKTFGLSVKDRGSILPAGHGANAAFWFEPSSGNFISSTWYKELNGKLPEWLQKFNAEKKAQAYKNQVWEPILPLAAYGSSSSDDKDYEKSILENQNPVFPYDLKKSDEAGFDLVRKTPFGNSLTMDCSLALIEGEGLGKDEFTDFLTLSFSCTDIVGHDFGPNSIEVEDTYLRLDRDLQTFFQFLDKKVGQGQYLVFLTADHGIMEVPEFLQEQTLPSSRFDEKEAGEKLRKFCQETFGSQNIILACENAQIYLDQAEMARLNPNTTEVESKILSFIKNLKGIYRAFLWEGTRPFPGIPFLEKYEKAWFKDRSGDIQLVMDPGVLLSERKKGTTHGAPYSYDSHVPCLWMGWKIKPGENSETFFIEDIAPTLADLLHIMEPNGCTGKPHFIPKN